MAHGRELRLAPLSATEADSICAELVKQAKSSGQGSAPIPSLEGRLEAAPQSLVESPPPVVAALPQPPAAMLAAQRTASQQLPLQVQGTACPGVERKEGEPQQQVPPEDQLLATDGRAQGSVRDGGVMRRAMSQQEGEMGGANSNQGMHLRDPQPGPSQPAFEVQAQQQASSTGLSAILASLQAQGIPMPSCAGLAALMTQPPAILAPVDEVQQGGGPAQGPSHAFTLREPVRQVSLQAEQDLPPGDDSGGLISQQARPSAPRGRLASVGGASSASEAQPHSGSWLLNLVREAGESRSGHNQDLTPALQALQGAMLAQSGEESGGAGGSSGIEDVREGEPVTKRARTAMEEAGSASEAAVPRNVGLLALIEELSTKSRAE